VAPGVERRDVREDGLVASWYVPPGDGPFPTILAVGGSDGGLRSETRWCHLASHGFATLVVAYFGVDPLPAGVAEVPTEYFSGAIDWLEHQDAADTERLGMTGISWGGQLTLLMASVEPRIRAAVAWVPSPVCWPGFAWGADGSPQFSERSSWTHRGSPLPHVHPQQATMDRMWEALGRGEQPDFANEVYGAALDDEAAVAAALFPLEQSNGPLLLISGDRDEIWPSTRLCDLAVAYLDRHAFPHAYEHVRYEGAGHTIYVPERPGLGLKFSGAAFGPTARASRDAWQRALAFFRANL
jgi:dienelactone hydrolase